MKSEVMIEVEWALDWTGCLEAWGTGG